MVAMKTGFVHSASGSTVTRRLLPGRLLYALGFFCFLGNDCGLPNVSGLAIQERAILGATDRRCLRSVTLTGKSQIRGQKRRSFAGLVQLATSSSEISQRKGAKKKGTGASSRTKVKKNSRKGTTRKNAKKTGQKQAPAEFPEDSVVHRLRQASLRAHAAAEKRQKEEAENQVRQHKRHQGNDDDEDDEDLPTMTELIRAIDKELLDAQMGPRPSMEERRAAAAAAAATNGEIFAQTIAPSDSMTAIVSHNGRVEARQSSELNAALQRFTRPTPTLHRHVAVVLAKPLQDDLVTREYAQRIQRLVRALQWEDYRPDMICFVGGLSPSIISGKKNRAYAADAGYVYFRHLCAAQGISLPDHVDIHLERTNIEQGALAQTAQYLHKSVLHGWIDQAAHEKQQQHTPTQNSTTSRLRQRRTLHVQFSLVSSEYHLCNLNDIHRRSPAQSALRALESNFWSSRRLKVILETSWTFLYATTVQPAIWDPVAALTYRFYQKTQELVPVLQNLKGVAANQEFFQRENYRALVASRRSLVMEMEQLYHKQPSLVGVKKVEVEVPLSAFNYTKRSGVTSPDGGKDDSVATCRKRLDIVLERSLLFLGRCSDLVRPAGLLTGIVPADDWKLACIFLEQAVQQVSLACDPDEPLPAHDWGHMKREDEKNRYHEQAEPKQGEPT